MFGKWKEGGGALWGGGGILESEGITRLLLSPQNRHLTKNDLVEHNSVIYGHCRFLITFNNNNERGLSGHVVHKLKKNS